jgi:hypothetical protein
MSLLQGPPSKHEKNAVAAEEKIAIGTSERAGSRCTDPAGTPRPEVRYIGSLLVGFIVELQAVLPTCSLVER